MGSRVAPGLFAIFLLVAGLTVLEGCQNQGAGNDMPEWVVVYPNVQPTVLTTEETGDERSGTVTFTAEDPAKDVLLFYRDRYRESSWKVDSTPFLRPDNVRGGQITAESPNKKRGVFVMVNALDDGRSETILNYSEVP